MSPVHGAAADDGADEIADDSAALTDAVMRALADPRRRRILRLVRGDAMPPGSTAAGDGWTACPARLGGVPATARPGPG